MRFLLSMVVLLWCAQAHPFSGPEFWGKFNVHGRRNNNGHDNNNNDDNDKLSMASGFIPTRGPDATSGSAALRHVHQHLDGTEHVQRLSLQHIVDPCVSCGCAVAEFVKVSWGPCAGFLLRGQVGEFCDSTCRYLIKLRVESLAHHCEKELRPFPRVRRELRDMTKQHALMCHKEEGELCLLKVRSVLKLNLEDVHWGNAAEANRTVDVLCHTCTAKLPLIVAAMEGLGLVAQDEIDVLNRAFKLHGLVCNTDRNGEYCFPRIAARAGLGSMPPPLYVCNGGLICDATFLQYLRLPPNPDVSAGQQRVHVPHLVPLDDLVAVCDPNPSLNPLKIAWMFKFLDPYGRLLGGSASLCSEGCRDIFSQHNVSLGEGDVIGVRFSLRRPSLVPSFVLTVDNVTCSVFAMFERARPILLTAFDELRAREPTRLDLVLEDNGVKMSQTEWVDRQVSASDLRIGQHLFEHLTSSESTLSRECTDSCVQRMILDLADLLKDTANDQALAVSTGLEEAAPLICVHQDNQFCAPLSRQPAVLQCVNGTGCAACANLSRTGCCAAASIATAGVFQPGLKSVEEVGQCAPAAVRCDPGAVEEKVEVPLDYPYEWFLNNEDENTQALKQDLARAFAPRKVLVVMVVEREEDHTVLAVVTVRGVAQPGPDVSPSPASPSPALPSPSPSPASPSPASPSPASPSPGSPSPASPSPPSPSPASPSPASASPASPSPASPSPASPSPASPSPASPSPASRSPASPSHASPSPASPSPASPSPEAPSGASLLPASPSPESLSPASPSPAAAVVAAGFDHSISPAPSVLDATSTYTKLQEKYARDHPDEQIAETDRFGVADLGESAEHHPSTWALVLAVVASSMCCLGLLFVVCLYRRRQVAQKRHASFVSLAAPKRLDSMKQVLSEFEPGMKPVKLMDTPACQEEVTVGIVARDVATGVPWSQVAPLPPFNPAAQNPEGLSLPPLRQAAQNPLAAAS